MYSSFVLFNFKKKSKNKQTKNLNEQKPTTKTEILIKKKQTKNLSQKPLWFGFAYIFRMYLILCAL